tara:strand:- start:498 stop:965 length:468 start_codon:yes stop_codon:yes gene_type:complete
MKKENPKKTKKQLEKEVKEYLEKLQRLQAEFENYQKRTEIEKQDIIKYSKKDLILNLLEILDNFERALENKDNQEGIQLIYKQLKETLEKENIEQIKEETFNPEKHEVISTGEGKENIILEEFQKGYTLHDKTIRTAKVKVGKGGKTNESKSSTN